MACCGRGFWERKCLNSPVDRVPWSCVAAAVLLAEVGHHAAGTRAVSSTGWMSKAVGERSRATDSSERQRRSLASHSSWASVSTHALRRSRASVLAVWVHLNRPRHGGPTCVRMRPRSVLMLRSAQRSRGAGAGHAGWVVQAAGRSPWTVRLSGRATDASAAGGPAMGLRPAGSLAHGAASVSEGCLSAWCRRP